ncbi:MAG: 4-alpha-glucanotransferase, partial [Deltaproteobacteria bacterium]|nr:4-alpha-glucanotransferase [Deltaproteobacteria bacterium]
MDGSELRFLHQLARLYGVETAYYDVEGEIQHASPEVLLLVLRTLGAPAERLSDARAALRERRRALWSQPLEPVAVARQDLPLQLKLRAASHLAGGTVPCRLHLEGGETRAWTCNLEQLQILKATEIEGIRYISKELVIPGALPLGYHRLSIELGGKLVEAMIISAPVRAYSDADALPGKVWGAFMPIYALHSQRSFG